MLRVFIVFLAFSSISLILFIFDGSCDVDNTMYLNREFRLNLPFRNRDLVIYNSVVEET